MWRTQDCVRRVKFYPKVDVHRIRNKPVRVIEAR